jgi:hypothetical protein
MAKPKFDLQPGECILLKASCVRHGFWSAFTDELVLTNQSIIHVSLGLFGNVKGVVRYQLSNITQTIIGEAQNGGKQLEVYHNGKMEDFAFQSGNRTLKVWSMAIADRFSENSEIYDYKYYQRFSDESVEQIVEYVPANTDGGGSGINGKFIGDVAKNVIKSGNFSVGGVVKGVAKASKKQARQSVTSGIAQEFKDELGITDLRDEFTIVGNEFRGMFGFKPKTTQREQKEQQMNATFDQQMAQAKQEAQTKQAAETVRPEPATSNSFNKMSLDEQIETIKKLKDLVDAGILTQEEFAIKKKEIMNF